MKNFLIFFLLLLQLRIEAQIVINEGSNRNYSSIRDEDGDFPDWIEIYNSGSSAVNLLGYSLSDDSDITNKWTFPDITIQPNEYRVIFCSGKDRKPITGFKNVLQVNDYTPTVGWNSHDLTSPFYWDGSSNLLISMCAYNTSGYTTNSVMQQSMTSYTSTVFVAQDGSNSICQAGFGTPVSQRPNMRFNQAIVGTGNIQNGNTDYPAPYGNWYWTAKHQMLVRASELSEAGLEAGDITRLSFDVVETDPNTVYNNIEFSMKLVSETALNATFVPVDTNINLHTNFKIASDGETVYLFDASQALQSSLMVNVAGLDHSTGSLPDASSSIQLFQAATPRASNNMNTGFSAYLQAPTFDLLPGLYFVSQQVRINNPNGTSAMVRYTLDGSEPNEGSLVYDGSPIMISSSQVLKARAFAPGFLPSTTTVGSFLIGVSHTTPILSVVTDNENLYGDNGIFDNWQFDWEKAAHVDYFDEQQQLLFSQKAGMQIDGGAGGSRSHPQHSFRIELDDPVLGEGKVTHVLLPNRPYRDEFSNLYLRNGSNQFLVLPYKDACQVAAMCEETNSYYSAWRPVTVYINGEYFGLYELREKFDTEYFDQVDRADPDSMELLSLSYWNGSVLRALQGSVDNFYTDAAAFNTLNAEDPTFWTQADQIFDMEYYVDYIVGQSWMGNIDWPGNNIKIYRSDASDMRWRFCTIDQELSLLPNGWTDRFFNHIDYMLNQNIDNPYINVWLKGMNNQRFRRYFINRFADLMNTSYQFSRIGTLENNFYSLMLPEMENTFERWGDPNAIPEQLNDFNNNHLVFRDELTNRSAAVRNHIEESLSLEGQVDITLAVNPAGAGKIRINTIIPTVLPWTGGYFNGNPVEITAIPNLGYQFLNWDANSVMSSINVEQFIDMNVALDATFTANFVPTVLTGALCISELNYHSDDTRNGGDWIEFHNYGNQAVDLSGWRFSDGGIANNYVFPTGASLQPGAYMVVVEDSLLFSQEYPAVDISATLGFGFSNSTETLTLYDAGNSTVVEMTYNDQLPWPQAADGFGRTLELAQNTALPNLASSWFHGCVGGSPGTFYSPCPEPVLFGEVNYSSSTSADAGDWVELFNAAPTPVNISNWKFSDSDDTHQFLIPAGTILPALGRMVLFSDDTKFSSRFPTIQDKQGPFDFGLSSGGEALRLYDNTGRLYNSMYYGSTSPWPSSPAGGGYTLELLSPTANLCEPTSWTAGCPEGSPSTPYIVPCFTGVTEATSNKVSVFPNPNDGNFQLVFDAPVSLTEPFYVKIYNMLGERIYQQSFNSRDIHVTLGTAFRGLFVIEITHGDQQYRNTMMAF